MNVLNSGTAKPAPFWEGGPCPFPSYTLAFALQRRKTSEILSYSSRLMLETRCHLSFH